MTPKVTRLHDWLRIYKSGATYMGTELWVFLDYAPRAVRRRMKQGRAEW